MLVEESSSHGAAEPAAHSRGASCGPVADRVRCPRRAGPTKPRRSRCDTPSLPFASTCPPRVAVNTAMAIDHALRTGIMEQRRRGATYRSVPSLRPCRRAAPYRQWHGWYGSGPRSRDTPNNFVCRVLRTTTLLQDGDRGCTQQRSLGSRRDQFVTRSRRGRLRWIL
jgi:hypothetical protein